MTDDSKAPATAAKKTKRHGNITVWVAIVLALVAGFANFQYARSLEGSRLTILKAKAPIPVATIVTSAMFDKIPVSGELEDMRGIFVEDTSLPLFQQLPLGQALKRGQPLMQSDFDPTVKGRRCQDLIKVGYRAVPLAADGVSTHTYGIDIGDVIDVHVEPGGVVKEKVLVCALDGRATVTPGARYSTLSILVRDSEVSRVVAMTRGSGKVLTFVQVGPSDSAEESQQSRGLGQ